MLADLGYLDEADPLTCPIKKPVKPAQLNTEQRTVNMLHAATRALAERGNSLLKTTFTAHPAGASSAPGHQPVERCG